jgi:membrane protease subunit HflC
MNRLSMFGVVVLAIGAFLANAALFTVEQTEKVLVAQFGEVVRPIDKPGLYVKVPLIQNVIVFDNRLLSIDLPGEEIILGDQRRLIVDSFTAFRVTDPLRFYQAIGPVPEGIRGRLSSIVTASLRRVMGNRTLLDVLSADRERIMASIAEQVNTEMRAFGVTVEDVRIRRADLPEENTQAILARMQSERQRVAAQARAEGAEAAARIRADAERERTVLLADAQAAADRTKGEGEAEATNIFAAAFGKDPEFFGFWRAMDGYKEALGGNNSRLVLTPDNDYLRYLQAPPRNEK